ncbi:hypothetical protein [Roseateles asaccharophilus]|uniref:Polysaccharide biosynthesis protein n=2 Tax=Roseateles asaccharophilus TaxID=582607 RepID=A0ABU2AEJ5_9BURK|nr:hypothetical protein [Roseateles asaccharophilus]MDR7335023.1 hypothetical protein [Roseateles asaccharophilus]
MTSSPDAPPTSDLPFFTRLLPGLTSLLMLAPTMLAYEFRGKLDGVAVALLWVQTQLLAICAIWLVAAAHESLRPWEQRVAPSTARERVRSQLLRDLAWLAGTGLAGPIAMAGVLDHQAGVLRLLPGALALLMAALCGGLALSLSWQGRATRGLMLPALAVLASLTMPGVVRAISLSDALQSLAIIGCSGLLLWGWMRSPRALSACAHPWPRPRLYGLQVWWRRTWSHRLWRTVPSRTSAGEYKRSGMSPLWLLIWAPQFMTHGGRLEWLSWGQSYDHLYAMLGYGVWLLGLGVAFGMPLVAPPLHWRLRLAPGGLTARRWARHLVLGSMLAVAVLLSAGLGLAAMTNKLPFWPVDASAWLSAMGDLLLVVSLAAWRWGRHCRVRDALLGGAALALAAPATLVTLTWLGLTPERGPVWLLIQLSLTVCMTRAAIRAWAQQDLNAMA